jgi:hypothetical protein
MKRSHLTAGSSPKRQIHSRRQLVQRIQEQLERRSYPRLQMTLLVTLTGGAGFLASFVLMIQGVDSLALRYPLAVGVAYLAFLALLWMWLRVGADVLDGPDQMLEGIVELLPDGSPRAATAHAQFPAESELLVELPDAPVPNIAAAADADELAIPLAVILILVGVVLTVLVASFSVVYSAPILFAEMLLDGVLAASLYRRLRRIETRHWLHSALRRTIVPFAITAALMAAAGWSLASYAPQARTLGEAIVVMRQAG